MFRLRRLYNDASSSRQRRPETRDPHCRGTVLIGREVAADVAADKDAAVTEDNTVGLDAAVPKEGAAKKKKNCLPDNGARLQGIWARRESGRAKR